MPPSIIHIDMDAFYAAIEQRDNPEFKGKPVIVGGDPDGRGVVSAASYEARKYGIHSAMPSATALKLCPRAVFLRPNMPKYVAVSKQLMAIFKEYTPLVEPLSLDESFLDVSGSERLFGNPVQIAVLIKTRIKEELGLTASAGVAPNKFIAKIASDLQKPDGLVVVSPDEIIEFLHPLPVSCIWGVGKVSQKRLHSMGIFTIGDLANIPLEKLESKLGKIGARLHQLAHGEDERPVKPRDTAKSMGHEETFSKDIGDQVELEKILLSICERVARRLRRNKTKAYTVNLKARYPDFQTVTRSQTLFIPTNDTLEIFKCAKELLKKTRAFEKKVRLLGVSMSNFTRGFGDQLTIFQDHIQKRTRVLNAFDQIRDKFGENTIKRASLVTLNKPGTKKSKHRVTKTSKNNKENDTHDEH